MIANLSASEVQSPQASPEDRPRPAAAPSPTGPWLTYRETAAYTGWSVPYLRNLVSAGQIPVYGKPRVRRFRRDMLDLFLTDPDAAMRRFRAERNQHGS
jgi:excisionase family DNA binding protein